MKLKTKIILINFLVVFSAMIISDVVLWRICRDALWQEAVQSAYAESYETFIEFEHYMDQVAGETGGSMTENEERRKDSDIGYFFKNRKDDYTICVGTGTDGIEKEYYNHTIFSYAVLEKYKEDAKRINEQNAIDYYKIDWNSSDLLCFSSYVHGLTLYHIVDISSTSQKLWVLAVGMGIVLVVITIAAAVILSVLIRRALHPLRNLSAAAMEIAEGNYDKRAEITSQDEIGALAGQFNKMADAVEKHTAELEESERRKNLFMGNLTHELKTPMTAISGYAETMRRIHLSEEEEAEALDYIYKECHRLERLSRKMMQLLELDYSEEIVKTKFPVQKLFDAVLKGCTAASEARGVSIVIRDTGEILNADFDLMCDALINLTDNAMKASKPGSEVQLYTEKEEDGFAIIVEDSGCGMTSEEAAQIFEPFYMADKSRSRKNGGAGLGLALTALILRNHEMTLVVDSEVGSGTKMRLMVLASGSEMSER